MSINNKDKNDFFFIKDQNKYFFINIKKIHKFMRPKIYLNLV